MKIAISASGNTLKDEVDQRFGRAPFFLIYDVEADISQFIENKQALNSPSGAGIQAAQNVLNAGVDAVLTGHCGPKAFRAFQAAGIPVYVNITGPLHEAVSAFKTGRLKPTDKADVEGHWM